MMNFPIGITSAIPSMNVLISITPLISSYLETPGRIKTIDKAEENTVPIFRLWDEIVFVIDAAAPEGISSCVKE